MSQRHLIIALLVLGFLICAPGAGFPEGKKGESMAWRAQDNEVIFSPFPSPSAGSARNWEEILKEDMRRAESCNERGIRYTEEGEFGLAISEFNKALQVHPLSAETYNNRGIAYSKKGEHDLAISDFTKALEIKPDMAKALYNRGITHGAKGQYKLALQDFNRSLELGPNHAPALVNRGSLHLILACSDWEKACRLGNCAHLEEAVRIGICILMRGNGYSSP
jgi:tetratricopeptide (TPR) repeat protein